MRMLNSLLSNLYKAAILNLFGESLTLMLVSLSHMLYAYIAMPSKN
jgi:hypothetical protein